MLYVIFESVLEALHEIVHRKLFKLTIKKDGQQHRIYMKENS
jgi:hypothetical protein